MTTDALLAALTDRVAAGQRGLSDTVRALVLHQREDLLTRVDFDDDRAFLDPLLFAHLTGGADPDGLATLLPAPPRPRVAGTDVALLDDHPTLARLFANVAGPRPVAVGADARQLADLGTAFAVLRQVHARYARLVAATTRAVVVFDAAAPNSFATSAAHGAVFLNARHGSGPVFFLEDLLHQCGHVVLLAATMFDADTYFTVPAQTPLGAARDPLDEPRSAYVLLHGVFTEALMADGLSRCLARRSFGGEDAGEREHELRGRLAYVLERMGADLDELTSAGVLAARGRLLVDDIAAGWLAQVRAHRGWLAEADTSGQPYNFDYAVYAARNPLRPIAAALR